MIKTNDSFILNTAMQKQQGYVDVEHNTTIRPCAYIEVFEGSIYDLIGLENSGIDTETKWKRLNIIDGEMNVQQGQSKSVTVILPKSNFETNGALNYNYDTGIYTSNTGVKLSKYLARFYEGYCENDYPYTEHPIKRFTGVVESIIPKEDGTIEVGLVDYSTIFLNVLNYNYPDIASYRDLPYSDTNETLQAPVDGTQTYIMLPTNTPRIAGDKIRIGSEVMVILLMDKSIQGKAFVQRLASIASHSAGDKIYISDSFLVMPEDVYNDRLLPKYVPAYDNWIVKDAIRDLCIKAKFPLNKVIFDYDGKETLRLGASDKYPYMNVKPVIDTYLTTQQGLVRQNQTSIYKNDGQTGYLKLERKLYTGINDESFNEAKFKFEFGKNLWECILAIVDGFGFKTYFDADGNLVIKGVRQYKWLPPIEDSGKTTLIENHAWYWKKWDITQAPSMRYTVSLPKDTAGIKFRFIANDVATSTMTVRLVKYNGLTYDQVGVNYVLPELQPFQYFELEVYRAARQANLLAAGVYGIEIVSQGATPAYFNGFLYLNNLDETAVYDASSAWNADIQSLVNSMAEVRNQITVIGQPKSQVPLISKVADIGSIYGGKNRIIAVTDGTETWDSKSYLMDGKYDKFTLVRTSGVTGGRVIIRSTTDTATINLVALYLKPQTTPVGTVINLCDIDTGIVIATHTVTSNDLSSQGFFFRLETGYTKRIIKITSTIDLEFSEIECYEDAQAYNFVGFKKETLVVKQNITDKATNDWIAYTQLEMHRRNVKSLEFSIYGNPLLETGDCILVNAPQLSANYDVRLWITGIRSKINKVMYVTTLTLVALPAAPSYTPPPAPDPGTFSVNEAYDFAVNKYEVGSNKLLSSAVWTPKIPAEVIEGGEFYLLNAINATDTTLVLSNAYDSGKSPYERLILNAEMEFSDTSKEAVLVKLKALTDGGTTVTITVERGSSYSTPVAHTPVTTTQNALLRDFTPGDQFLTFAFALPEAKKVQFVVGVKRLNQVLAYVMEEKCIPAGVYKRENGIRWDGGINFAKVWPDTVDKIYLPPQQSFNMMYNRMFHTGATSSWEDPKNNFYWWAFDQNLYMQYVSGSGYPNGDVAKCGWRKTPYQWNAQIIVKPVLEGYNGSRALVPAVTKTIDITVKAPTHKLIWGETLPLVAKKSEFTVITASVRVSKDDVVQDLNDCVYFDAYVTTDSGGNVNLINAGANNNAETGRRWVTSAGLHSFIQWDMTDSQGKFITAGKYKFCLLNVFDIFGEGVEVIKETTMNLVDGSLKNIKPVGRTVDIMQGGAAITVYEPADWSIISSLAYVDAAQTYYKEWPGKIIADKVITDFTNRMRTEVHIVPNMVMQNGQQGSTDPYLKLTFTKKNKVQAYTWSSANTVPFRMDMTTQKLEKIVKPADVFFFSFYYIATNSLSNLYTTSQIWNLYVIINYMDTNGVLQTVYKPIEIPLNNTNVWSLAHQHITPAELPNVYKITSVGLQSRALDSEAYAAIPTAFNTTWNGEQMTLGIDSIQFGTGTEPPPTYQDPSGGPRAGEIITIED